MTSRSIAILIVCAASGRALAQTSPTTPTTPAPPATTPPPADTGATPADQPPAAPKQPKAGDFDAGGQVRLPNGPDATGQFATFHWVAVDLKAKYYLYDSVTLNAVAPVAIVHPDMLMDGTHPSMIGGMTVRLDAMAPKLPKMPFVKYDTEVGLTLAGGYAREGAMLLGEKDFPDFTGNFEPGFIGGAIIEIKLSSLLDLDTQPVWVIQKGTTTSHRAVQVPVSTVIRLGELVQASVDAGLYTGDGYTVRGSKGGRLSAGASLTVKLGPIVTHVGAGAASLLTGGMYPTIRDSVYLDVNVKYAK